MKATLLTTPEQLSALAPAWNDLLSRSRDNGMSLTPTWVLTWWRIFGKDRGRRLRCVAFHEGERLVGFAPLTWRRHWYRPALPFRRLEFLGTGELPDEAICPEYLNVIAEEGREVEVATALADEIYANRLGGWDEVFLETLAGDSAMTAALATALASPPSGRRSALTREEYDTSFFVALPKTHDEYLTAIGKQRKPSLRALRNFDEWATGEWQLHTATDTASLAAGNAALLSLHQGRWAGTGQGTFKAAKFIAFHESLMPALLAEGKLQLAWLTVRDEPVVAAYNFVHAGKVWYYQTGRKLEVPPKIRLGVVLLLKLIFDAIDRGHREFDFLPGVALYKEQLATASRPIVRLRLARPTWVESLRAWSRRWLRRGT